MLAGLRHPAEVRARQMELYDRLGPLTRAAIGNSTKDFDVELLFQKFDRRMVYRGKTIRTDFQNPETDANIARFVNETIMGRFMLSFWSLNEEKPESFALVARRREGRRLHGTHTSDQGAGPAGGAGT